jgi:hypothetical protein
LNGFREGWVLDRGAKSFPPSSTDFLLNLLRKYRKRKFVKNIMEDTTTQ